MIVMRLARASNQKALVLGAFKYFGTFGSDANDIDKSGYWVVYDAATNIPMNYGILVSFVTTAYRIQLLFTSRNDMYFRFYSPSNSWTAWKLTTATAV